MDNLNNPIGGWFVEMKNRGSIRYQDDKICVLVGGEIMTDECGVFLLLYPEEFYDANTLSAANFDRAQRLTICLRIKDAFEARGERVVVRGS